MGNENSVAEGQSAGSSSPSTDIRRFKSAANLFDMESKKEKQERQRRITDEKLGNVSMENLPSEDEVNEKFEKLVKELSLPEDKVKLMRQLPLDKKWKLMKQHQFSSGSLQKTSSVDSLNEKSGGAVGSGAAHGTIGALKSQQKYIDVIIGNVETSEVAKELVSLEVALRTLPLSWVEEFIDIGGMDAMIKSARVYALKHRPSLLEREVQRQFIRCFASIMNNSTGLRSMMRKQDAINTMILLYDCDNIKMKAKLLELAGGISLIFPVGHGLILDAFTNYRKTKLEEFRFQSVVSDFGLNDLEYQVSAMAFLTAFVNTPEELDVRVSLRFELMNLGIDDIISGLRETKGVQELQTHLDTFELEAETDFEELAEDGIQLHEVELQDPDEVFAAIKESITEPNGYQWLLRMLQQILTLSHCDYRKRSFYYQLMWALANEVVLQRNAIRLRHHILNFNLQKMIDGFATQEQFQQVQHDCEDLRKQVASFGKDIESVQELLTSKEQQIGTLTKELEQSKEYATKMDSEMKGLRHKVEIQAKHIQELKHGVRGSHTSASLAEIEDTARSRSLSNAQETTKATMETSATADVLDDLASMPSPDGGDSPEMTNAPPPPPPPLFGGAPPPPPPPGMAAVKAPEKPRLKVQAGVKMRQMNWSKMNNTAGQKTIWGKLSTDDEYVQNQLDFKELESLFGIVEKSLKKKEKAEGQIEERKIINLLDSKKSYSLSILLSRVKMSLVEIKQAVLEMAEEKLGEALLKQLQNYIPTAEEQTVLYENLEHYDYLGKPEQFYIEILKISRYEQRLTALNFKRRYQEKVGEILPSMEIVLKASNEVKTSKKLHQLLEIVLTIGNFMNGASFRGNAYGFQIDMISKLADIKTNQKGNFMNYLCTVIDNRFPELNQVTKDIASVEKASKVSLQYIIEEFTELKKGLAFLREELPRHENPDNSSDKFYKVMKSFLDISMPVFNSIENLRFNMEQAYTEALIFFNEDSKTTPETFFAIFSVFLQNLDKARKENEREAEIARKAEQINTAEVQRLQKRQKKQNEILSQNDRGVMDELISSLKNGSFMATTASERRQNKRMSRMIEKPDNNVEMLDAEKLLNDLRATYGN